MTHKKGLLNQMGRKLKKLLLKPLAKFILPSLKDSTCIGASFGLISI